MSSLLDYSCQLTMTMGYGNHQCFFRKNWSRDDSGDSANCGFLRGGFGDVVDETNTTDSFALANSTASTINFKDDLGSKEERSSTKATCARRRPENRKVDRDRRTKVESRCSVIAKRWQMKVTLWAAKVRTFVCSAARWPLTIVATDRNGCRTFFLREEFYSQELFKWERGYLRATKNIFQCVRSACVHDMHRLGQFSILI